MKDFPQGSYFEMDGTETEQQKDHISKVEVSNCRCFNKSREQIAPNQIPCFLNDHVTAPGFPLSELLACSSLK